MPREMLGLFQPFIVLIYYFSIVYIKKFLFYLKVETCGFLLWEGFQPNIRLAYQSSSMLLIYMGMRYVHNFNCCHFLYINVC